MNKLLTFVASLMIAAASFASTANSVEFKIGVGGVSSAYYGNVTETKKDSGHKTSEEALAAFSYMSGFAEVGFEEAMGLTLGLEWVPESINIEEAVREIKGNANQAGTSVGEDTHLGKQKIKASVKDMVTAYVAIPVMGTGLNVKAGYRVATLVTEESLASGSSYKDVDLDGTTIGVFYDGAIGERAFYRIEGAYNQFDDIALTGSEVGGTSGSFNKIDAELGGAAIC
jgi:hypothetical protein